METMVMGTLKMPIKPIVAMTDTMTMPRLSMRQRTLKTRARIISMNTTARPTIMTMLVFISARSEESSTGFPDMT